MRDEAERSPHFDVGLKRYKVKKSIESMKNNGYKRTGVKSVLDRSSVNKMNNKNKIESN